jgi:diol dehydratase reactivase alpha subunit
MIYVAGVDVGNNTTEIAIAAISGKDDVRFLSSGMVPTVGIKGTVRNAMGIIDALDRALGPIGIPRKDLHLILLNEATPVIGDIAMETITETVITESAMIGHNPSTPGGQGLEQGRTIHLDALSAQGAGSESLIAVVPGETDFEGAAAKINAATARGVKVVGAIVQKDDGVLINNRLTRPIPIVDEVKFIDRVPVGMPAALEVAPPGRTIERLSNPYDIATLFCLDPEETKRTVPVARALMGTRSAVVIKTPKGDIEERRIPAGKLILLGHQRRVEVPVDEGADAIMDRVAEVYPLEEIQAETGTNVGGMFEHVRNVMADLTDQPVTAVKVQDILAVDTFKPQQILGSLAGEYALGNAVGLAAMVSTQKLPMMRLARKLEEEIGVRTVVGGVEADMAIRGAMTTPGTRAPMAIIDVGGGSTDASVINDRLEIKSTHQAGAGDMVTMLINTELGLDDFELAESVKKFPLAKVESLFHMRHENGSVEFFEDPLDPRLFGRTIVLQPGNWVPLETKELLGKVVAVRQQAKRKVFVRNALRALKLVAPGQNIRMIHFVVLVGGSGLDFEIPKMISDALMEYGVVTGRANVRGSEGPRNAVATGLVLAYAKHYEG